MPTRYVVAIAMRITLKLSQCLELLFPCHVSEGVELGNSPGIAMTSCCRVHVRGRGFQPGTGWYRSGIPAAVIPGDTRITYYRYTDPLCGQVRMYV